MPSASASSFSSGEDSCCGFAFGFKTIADRGTTLPASSVDFADVALRLLSPLPLCQSHVLLLSVGELPEGIEPSPSDSAGVSVSLSLNPCRAAQAGFANSKGDLSQSELGNPPATPPLSESVEIAVRGLSASASATQWDTFLDLIWAFGEHASGRAEAAWRAAQRRRLEEAAAVGTAGGGELLNVAARAAQAAARSQQTPLKSVNETPSAAGMAARAQNVSFTLLLGGSLTLWAGPERFYGSSAAAFSTGAGFQEPLLRPEANKAGPSRWEVLPCVNLRASVQAQAEVLGGELSSLCADVPAATLQTGSVALRHVSTGSGEETPSAQGRNSPCWQARSETTPLVHVQGAQVSTLMRMRQQEPQPAREPPSSARTLNSGAQPPPVRNSSDDIADPSAAPTSLVDPSRSSPPVQREDGVESIPASGSSIIWASVHVQSLSVYAGPASLSAAARFSVAVSPASSGPSSPPGANQGSLHSLAKTPGGLLLGQQGNQGDVQPPAPPLLLLSLPDLQAQLSAGCISVLVSGEAATSEPCRPLFEAALLDSLVSVGVRHSDRKSSGPRGPFLTRTSASAPPSVEGNEGRTLSVLASCSALVDVYNAGKLGWEPVVEPFEFQSRYASLLNAVPATAVSPGGVMPVGHTASISVPGSVELTASPSLIVATTTGFRVAGDVQREAQLFAQSPLLSAVRASAEQAHRHSSSWNQGRGDAAASAESGARIHKPSPSDCLWQLQEDRRSMALSAAATSAITPRTAAASALHSVHTASLYGGLNLRAKSIRVVHSLLSRPSAGSLADPSDSSLRKSFSPSSSLAALASVDGGPWLWNCSGCTLELVVVER